MEVIKCCTNTQYSHILWSRRAAKTSERVFSKALTVFMYLSFKPEVLLKKGTRKKPGGGSSILRDVKERIVELNSL